MGQENSKANIESVISKAVSSYQEKLNFIKLRPSTSSDSCLSHLCLPNAKITWRDSTTTNLKTITQSKWPKLIMNLLKQTETNNMDHIYQADMQWTTHNLTGMLLICRSNILTHF